MMPISSF